MRLKGIYNTRYFINFFPVILLNGLFFLSWYIISKMPNLAIIEYFIGATVIFFSGIINPIYLLFINFRYAWQKKLRYYLHNLFLMIISTTIGIRLSYFILRRFERPYPGRKDFIISEFILSIYGVLFIGIIEQVILFIKFKKIKI
jgi:hypothetical protein